MNEKEKLDHYIAKQMDRQIEDICRLVRIESVRGEKGPETPFGAGPAKALEVALDTARNMGFPVFCIDGCIGVVEGGGKEPGVDILAHLDVVPGGDGWTVTEPFAPLVKNGRIYGRGAADNKGPAVSVLYALNAVKSLGIPLRKKVRILWGTAEETGCEDLPHFYNSHDPAPMTVSPDASFPVITKEKGRFEGHLSGEYETGDVCSLDCEGPSNAVPARAFAVLGSWVGEQEVENLFDGEEAEYTLCREKEGLKIRVEGKGAHSASPQNGDNALVKLLHLLSRLPGTQKRLKDLAKVFPYGDHQGTRLGITPQGREPFTVSLNCLCWNERKGLYAICDCRIPVGMTKEMVVPLLTEAMKEFGILVRGTWTEPHMVSDDSSFVKTLLACWEECSKRPGIPKAIAGNTYAHGIVGAVAYGFADPDIRTGTHGPDEYVLIDQLLLGTRIYARMILELCR